MCILNEDGVMADAFFRLVSTSDVRVLLKLRNAFIIMQRRGGRHALYLDVLREFWSSMLFEVAPSIQQLVSPVFGS